MTSKDTEQRVHGVSHLIPTRFRTSIAQLFPSSYAQQCWYELTMASAYLQFITLESKRLKGEIKRLDKAVEYCVELVSPQVERPELRSLPCEPEVLLHDGSLRVTQAYFCSLVTVSVNNERFCFASLRRVLKMPTNTTVDGILELCEACILTGNDLLRSYERDKANKKDLLNRYYPFVKDPFYHVNYTCGTK
jgi:hypothetical protein